MYGNRQSLISRPIKVCRAFAGWSSSIRVDSSPRVDFGHDKSGAKIGTLQSLQLVVTIRQRGRPMHLLVHSALDICAQCWSYKTFFPFELYLRNKVSSLHVGPYTFHELCLQWAWNLLMPPNSLQWALLQFACRLAKHYTLPHYWTMSWPMKTHKGARNVVGIQAQSHSGLQVPTMARLRHTGEIMFPCMAFKECLSHVDFGNFVQEIFIELCWVWLWTVIQEFCKHFPLHSLFG